MNLNEYKLQINTDEDLEKWKSTWDGISMPPPEVINYVRSIILPRLAIHADKRLSEMEIIVNENK